MKTQNGVGCTKSVLLECDAEAMSCILDAEKIRSLLYQQTPIIFLYAARGVIQDLWGSHLYLHLPWALRPSLAFTYTGLYLISASSFLVYYDYVTLGNSKVYILCCSRPRSTLLCLFLRLFSTHLPSPDVRLLVRRPVFSFAFSSSSMYLYFLPYILRVRASIDNRVSLRKRSKFSSGVAFRR